MTEIGRLAIVLGFIVAIWGVVASIIGGLKHSESWTRSGRNAGWAFTGLTTVATGCLLQLLFARDFNVEYVASYSSSTLPLWYTFAALWGGMKGSLLFWTFILCLFNGIVLYQNRTRNQALMQIGRASCRERV